MSEEEVTPPVAAAEESKESPADGGEEDVANTHEEESQATFEPVVRLAEVETRSGEEEEEVVFGVRAKLFVYGETLLDQGSGNKSWKERGIGDIRILRHREHQKLRVLMRQEKTMKVIANHVLDPRINLEPNVGSDRSWVWSAFDFSDGTLVETVFAVRFADSDVAQNFKSNFIKCQKEMADILAGEDRPGEDEGAGADEVTVAIQNLSTGGEKTEEPST